MMLAPSSGQSSHGLAMYKCKITCTNYNFKLVHRSITHFLGTNIVKLTGIVRIVLKYLTSVERIVCVF